VIIDVHAHYFPKEYMDIWSRVSGRDAFWNLETPVTDRPDHIDGRLRLMDEAGVEMQILSPAGNAPYARDEADGIAAARTCNDTYADLVRRHPDRIASFVSLPMPHVEASLRELTRGLDELGMVGVTINCEVFGEAPTEPRFDPLYEEMNRRGCVLFFHPDLGGFGAPLIDNYGLGGCAGTSMQDCMVTLHLILRKMAARYPNITYVIPHLGGPIQMLLERLDNQMTRAHRDLPEPPSVTARRFYYDTVSHGSAAAIQCACRAVGADHLVPGSDYPVLLDFESYKDTFDYIRRAGLAEADVDQILNRTAQTILGPALAAPRPA
jgi:predicted TIM-barrel fold metal-dependent hydrolase